MIIILISLFSGDWMDIGNSANVQATGTGIIFNSNASSIFYNPGLFNSKSSFIIAHKETKDISHAEIAALQLSNNYMNYGFGLYYLWEPGIVIPQKDSTDNIDTLKVVTTHELFFNISYGYRLRFISTGVSMNIIHRNLYSAYAWGGGIDIGSTLNLYNFSIAIALKNIIMSPQYWNTGTIDTTYFNFEIALGNKTPLLKDTIQTTFSFYSDNDAVKSLKDPLFKFSCGIMYKAHNFYVGTSFRPNEFNTGIGINFHSFFVDYSLTNLRIHTLSGGKFF